MAKGSVLGKTVFVVVVMGLGIYASQKPWRALADQKRELKRVESEMRTAEAERAKLIRQKTHTESSLNREASIRDSGYHKTNEKPIDLD